MADGVRDTRGRAQIMAAVLIEGDLSCDRDLHEQGLLSTDGAFDLHREMMIDSGLDHLQASVRITADLSTRLQASLQAIDQVSKCYHRRRCMLWQGGGQTPVGDPTPPPSTPRPTARGRARGSGKMSAAPRVVPAGSAGEVGPLCAAGSGICPLELSGLAVSP